MTIVKGCYTQYKVIMPVNAFKGATKLILTCKNRIGGDVIFTRAITSDKLYKDGNFYDVITPEEAERVRNNARFDFDKLLNDGRRFRMKCADRVQIQYGVGRCEDE
ncbi:MAG: hypothetical protein HUJ51_06600 [Eggerthellaceae bacterium]|nr:hypothetical protein [Eggerthellaceae bacterium]